MIDTWVCSNCSEEITASDPKLMLEYVHKHEAELGHSFSKKVVINNGQNSI